VAREHKAALGFVGIALLGYLAISVRSLGFTRDDWNHYVNMRDLHKSLSLPEALSQLTSNEWFGGHELRIFFGSFFTHYLLSPLEGLASFAAYAVQTGMHVASAAIVGYLVWRLLGSQLAAVCTALLLTFAPTISQPSLWINNLFFVQPWFLLCVTLLALIVVRRGWLRTILVSVLAIACQFSGEATIPLLYGVLITFAVLDLRSTPGVVKRVQAVIPTFLGVAALAFYLDRIVIRPPGQELHLPGWVHIQAYSQGVRDQFIAMSDVTSAQFGAGSLTPSWPTIIVMFLLAGCGVAATLLSPGRMTATRKRQWQILSFLVGGLLLALVPLMLGMVTGARPGPDLRYLYVPSQVLYAGIVVMLSVITARLGARGLRSIKGLLCVIVAYSICTTTYNVMDIWGHQREIDAQIWAKVDSVLTPSTRRIITFNPNHQYLMAPYHSNAVSDFQADWGVAGRISWLHPDWERLQVFRDARSLPNGDVALRGYYGDVVDCLHAHDAVPGQTIYMTYDYGPTFADLDSSPLLVTTSLDEYERSRDEILSRHQDAQIWPVESYTNGCNAS
jgi:hypothetical protein